MRSLSPLAQYSPLYFLYFSLFGVLVPYLARYLSTVGGLNGQQISIIVALFFGVNIFAPFLFANLADKLGQRLRFIQVGLCLLLFAFLFIPVDESFLSYMCVFGLIGVFIAAILPQLETVTLEALGEAPEGYGIIRLWGSVGFVCFVWAMGYVIDLYSVLWLKPIGGVLIVLMMLSTAFISPVQATSTKPQSRLDSPSILKEVDWRQVGVLLFAILLWQFGLAPYNTFFDLYLRDSGYSAGRIGFLISLGTLSEILIFLYARPLLKRFNDKLLLSFAFIVTAIRWFLLAEFSESMLVVLISQFGHAMTFGLIHLVAVQRIGRLFPPEHASFGQGLYVSVGMGIGLLVGNLMAGVLWANEPESVYFAGAIWAVFALFVVIFGMKKASPE